MLLEHGVQSTFFLGRLGYPDDVMVELQKICSERNLEFIIDGPCKTWDLDSDEGREIFARFGIAIPMGVTIRARRGQCTIKMTGKTVDVILYGGPTVYCAGISANLYNILAALSELRKEPEFIKLNRWIWIFEVPIVKVTPACPEINELIHQALTNVMVDYCKHGVITF